MKRLIRFGSIGLVIAGAIAVSGEVFAQTVPPEISMYYKTSANGNSYSILLTGTPRTQIPVTLSGQTVTRTKSAKINTCGHHIITNASSYTSYVLAGIAPVNLATVQSLAESPDPLCVAGQSTPITGEAIKLSGDRILLKTLVTSANGRFLDATYTKAETKSKYVTLNQCGIGTVSIGTSLDGSIAVNGGTSALLTSFSAGVIPAVKCIGNVIGVYGAFPLDTEFKNSKGDYIVRTNPSAKLSFTIPGSTPVTKSVTSDRCGGLVLGSATNPQTDAFSINGVTVDPATLSVGLKPSCKLTGSTYAYDVAPSGNFKTSSGQVFLKSTTANPTGFGDRIIHQFIASNSNGLKTYTANACGMITVKNPASLLDSTGGAIDLATLPLKEMACATVNGNAESYRYEP